MSKSLTVILALAAGLAGGLLNRYVAPPAAHAQDAKQPAAEVRAQSFVLVDSADRPVGTFTSELPPGQRRMALNPVRIVLRDPSGREIWSAGGTGIHPISER